MFCASLRKRPSYAAILPRLAATSELESRLVGHDLALPLHSDLHDPKKDDTHSKRQLRVLLLAPSAVADAKLDHTHQRMQRFASLTGGQDSVIIFLLSPPAASTFVSARKFAADSAARVGSGSNEGVYAYSKLQASLIEHPGTIDFSIMPLATLDDLPDLLKRHVANLAHRKLPSTATPKQVTAFDLLGLCTANQAPMPQQTVYFLSDIFSDLRDLASACAASGTVLDLGSSSAGVAAISSTDYESDADGDPGHTRMNAFSKLEKLRDLVGEVECRDIIDFWKEEWAID